jgi:transcriptional regulator with XRE-family HTH domain
MPTRPNRFCASLRWGHSRRGLSQRDLAGAAGTSQRHPSFLESGRTAPSQAMALGLAAAHDLPLRHQYAPLLAAGYAPARRESDLTAPALAQVNSALEHDPLRGASQAVGRYCGRRARRKSVRLAQILRH